MLRTIIVDDEFPAREELKYMLRKIDSIEIIGEAENALEALKLCEKLRPDLVFLDIEMPKMTGIDLAKIFMGFRKPPKVIFVTAYDRFAIEAFEVNAIDYLLKPIDEDKLRKSLENKVIDQEDLGLENFLKDYLERDSIDRLTVYKGDSIIPINVEDIVYVTVEKKITYLVTVKDRYSINMTLSDLMTKLSPHKFFRSHKSFIVNLDKIQSIEPWFNSTFNIKLEGLGETIPVSRSNVKDFKAIMNMD